MSYDVNLAGAAAELHRSYDWMQKHWRRLVRDEGFPMPFVGGEVGARPWWRVAAIVAWKDQRSGLAPSERTSANIAQPQDLDPRTANDPTPQPVAPRAGAARLLAAAGGRA
jgi:hypothetical protein